ncbi:uncharacterized protein LOC121423217 [Lytechinus variegatus]|uniref:uncharacterized protein LOC121423217 n=1 Tax=Lytechinus variegatus TaxID=7654 RepID=UPI001BB19E42|nr:uncharacterized protein LOC121423217 [Lytechinus variegatus]
MASTQNNTTDLLEKLKQELRAGDSWATPKVALICEEIDKAFWKCQDKAEFTQFFCDCGGSEILVSILKKFDEDGLFGAWETAFIIYNCLCNMSEASLPLSVQLGLQGMVKLCANNIVKYAEKMHLKDVQDLVRISLSILCNLSTAPNNRVIFRQEGVAEKMQPYLTGDPFLKSICMITLSYIAEEGQEATLAQQGTDTTEYLVRILKDAIRSPDRRYRGLCDREIALALGRLAVHDGNKFKIIEGGGLPLLVEMLKFDNAHSQQAAADTIRALALSAALRQRLQEDVDCMRALESLSQSTDTNLSDAAKGALWVIRHG